MIMHFDFLTRTEIRFGRGRFSELPGICDRFGQRLLLVTGGRSLEQNGRLKPLLDALRGAGLRVSRVSVDREPDTQLVDNARKEIDTADCILAVGGGSVIDTGKALSALITNPGSILDYLEGLPEGGGNAPGRPAVPLVAAPTTAGTGSEVTKNAVIQIERWGIKRSMRSESMLPETAVIDPALLETAPQKVLAASAFDALAHLLESWVSRNASPVTDALAETGLVKAVSFLDTLQSGKPAANDFEDIALAATLGGICLANARLGAAHGLVSPLCGKTGMSHGLGVALLLPAVIRTNHRLLKEREAEHPAIVKLEKTAEMLGTGGDVDRAADVLMSWMRQFDLDCPDCDLDREKAAEIASSPSSSIRTNPVELDQKQKAAIVRSIGG